MQSLLSRIKNNLSFLLFLNLVIPTFLVATSFQLDNLNPTDQTVDVLYDFEEGDVAGFQFEVSGLTLSGASGGAAADAEFEVSTGTANIVLGFSFAGASIPSGSGILTTLSYSDITSDQACIVGTVASLPISEGGGAYISDGGSCISTSVPLTAGLSLGAFDSSGSLEILYDFSGGSVAGFQFDVSGLALTGGSGGAAGDAGLTVSAGGATVLGFSMTNAEIAAGSGVLTVLSFSSITDGTTELSLGNFGAVTDASGNQFAITTSGSIAHDVDCAGDYYGSAVEDECGACNGGGIADGACDCDGNVADCAGECGGSAVEDECGVCDGSGAADGFDCAGNCIVSATCGNANLSFGAVTDQSAEILYSSNVDVGGFQFTVDGVELTGISSALSDTYLAGSTGIVLGFSMSGEFLPAGDGVLAILSFAPTNDGSSLSVSGVTVSSTDTIAITLASSGPGSTATDGCYETDCADVCYGDGAEDECGVCNGDGIADGACDCNGNVDLGCGCGEDGPLDNFDCDGNCIVDVDCNDECGGSAALDECGV